MAQDSIINANLLAVLFNNIPNIWHGRNYSNGKITLYNAFEVDYLYWNKNIIRKMFVSYILLCKYLSLLIKVLGITFIF
jgi:hypothetical protein